MHRLKINDVQMFDSPLHRQSDQITNPIEITKDQVSEEPTTLLGYLRQYFFDKMTLKDNIFIFTFNQTLLNSSIKQLRQVEKLRVRYIQIDSKHKCVPTDWYLGYDTFAIYTFYQLSGNQGFLRSMMNNRRYAQGPETIESITFYLLGLPIIISLQLTFYSSIHHLNKFVFQFEHLINLLDNGFEHLITVNIREAITRRVEQQIHEVLLQQQLQEELESNEHGDEMNQDDQQIPSQDGNIDNHQSDQQLNNQESLDPQLNNGLKEENQDIVDEGSSVQQSCYYEQRLNNDSEKSLSKLIMVEEDQKRQENVHML
ncbi:UNKNOWN [Stylonychia lemnae]|uniref:Uncharacterized protein n=1 Tax=Stylonychia lemnae TaxID=5949 RepID=A0A077ZTR2_STYLE|nr:UNKNOWN [Stylonychia lemnae]|eukprot:CDW71816.1 UNKNOWN [Stylonychia lemnae]